MSKTKIQKKTTETTVVTSDTTAQPHPQESKPNKLEFHNFIKNEFIAQSQTFSNVTRTIAGVVLGTIWMICYKGENVEIPNSLFVISIILAIFFFLIELAHYYSDTKFYHDKSDDIVKSKGNFIFKNMYNEVQAQSKKSFLCVRIKARLVLLLSIVFILGVIQLYLSNAHPYTISIFNLILYALLGVQALTFLIISIIIAEKDRWPKPTDYGWAFGISDVIMTVVIGLKISHII